MGYILAAEDAFLRLMLAYLGAVVVIVAVCVIVGTIVKRRK